jgi:hypothetical protein
MAEAMGAYRQALEKASPDRSLMAIAKFGLGLCEEELGNFDQAEPIYREVADDPLFEGTVAAAQARLRLDTMADYKTKVVFKLAPIPKRRPAELPPTLPLRPADMNLPVPSPNAIPLPPGVRKGPNAPNTAPLLQGIDQWLAPPNAVPAMPDTNRQAQPPNAVPLLPDVRLSPKGPDTAPDVIDTNQPDK